MLPATDDTLQRSGADGVGCLEVPAVECYLESRQTQTNARVYGSGGNTITPAWRYRPSGVVWRVVPTASGKLIGESRDLQKKLASFFCLNLRTGEVLWEEARFGEPWWIGIEAVHADTVLLHRFAHPDLPVHRGVIAVDVLTGAELWRNDEVTFHALGEQALAVRREHALHTETLRLDYRTGVVLETDRPFVAVAPMEDIAFPSPLEESERDEWEAVLLRRVCDADALIWPVDVLEHDRVIIYNYYLKRPDFSLEHPHMRSILSILEKVGGAVLFTESLCDDAHALVPDAFLVTGDMLLYIHERTTLTALDVCHL